MSPKLILNVSIFLLFSYDLEYNVNLGFISGINPSRNYVNFHFSVNSNPYIIHFMHSRNYYRVLHRAISPFL